MFPSKEGEKAKTLQKIKDKFGDVYDYSKTEYLGATKKITITCRTHGDFDVWPFNYLKGAGCVKCSTARNHQTFKATTEQFIEKARAKHGDRYDYSKSVYTGKSKKITITCKEHGDFEQIASNHYINGAGCLTCGVKKAHRKIKNSAEKVTTQGKNVVPSKKEVVFTPSTNEPAKAEQDLFSYIQSLVGDAAIHRFKVEPNLEADIGVPSKGIAFEYNGLFWHSEQMGKGINYHVTKTEKFKAHGIRLIHIFEDEWIDHQGKVKSKIQHLLGVNPNKIYARKLEAKIITSDTAKRFFNLYHIQGAAVTAFYNIGLFTKEGVMVAAMNFCWDRYSKTEDTVELLRFASSRHVVGGASKLLTFFLRNLPQGVKKVISYSDRRWSEGNLYQQLGFSLVNTSIPSYFYSKGDGKRINRQRFQKHRLSGILDNFDPSKTEVQNCIDNGYFRVFDCGTHKWELKIETQTGV